MEYGIDLVARIILTRRFPFSIRGNLWCLLYLSRKISLLISPFGIGASMTSSSATYERRPIILHIITLRWVTTNVKFLHIKIFFNQSFDRILWFSFDQKFIIPDILKNCNLFWSETPIPISNIDLKGNLECYSPSLSVGHISQPNTRRNFLLITLFSNSTCNKNTKI